jgi:hypothetical protein
MNSFDAQEARQRVQSALATMTPRPAPASLIRAQGRGIRRRRRAALAGLLAGVAALAVAAPGLLGQALPGTEPPGRPAGPLTINKPGPSNEPGVIGSGTLDGKSWKVWLAGGPDPVAEATGLPATGAVGIRPDGPAPATFHSAGSGAQRSLAGPVSPDVAYLTMQLADGTVFTLYPATWHGHDYLGLVVPKNLGIVRFTAYSRHGELAYAIPFPDSGFPDVVSWLRPGAAVPSAIEMTVGSEPFAVNWWTVEAQIGPWGTCLVQTSGSGEVWCVPGGALPPNAVTSVMLDPALGVVSGITGRAVASIDLTLAHGKTTPLLVVHLGSQGFFALSVRDQHIVRWTAYNTAGWPVASGTGAPG